MDLRIVPFAPGRRPTDEDVARGLGSSDQVAFVTGEGPANRAVVLVEVGDVPAGVEVDVTVSVEDAALPGWAHRVVELTGEPVQRIVLHPDTDFATVDLGLRSGFLRRAWVDVRARVDGEEVGGDEAWLDVADVRNLGSLYERIIERLIGPDTTRQAAKAGVDDPGDAYHPWYPVLRIGGEKAALYTAALVADIVGKEDHLTDPAWLLRVGVYLELLTCIGIFEAVRDDVGDLLDDEERAAFEGSREAFEGSREAFEGSDAFAEIRARIQPEVWREIWDLRRITFPGFGSPRTGPVSALNLLRKRDATLRFLHAHHDDLKHAIELAGPNRFSSQETWQRVFRDAERAVLRKAGDAFPELSFLPGPAREVVLWQRFGFAGQQGVYATACNQYRASMNAVAEWARARGLMEHAGAECIPAEVSLLEAYGRDEQRLRTLQRQDGLGPDLTVCEPVEAPEPSTAEIEWLLADVPIFAMLGPDDLHRLALGARPLLLGPTQRFVVEGHEGTSLFLVGDGEVEVRRRREDGSDWLVDTMGRGEVVGEMALLTGETRAATVRAVDETVVYEICRAQYEPLVREHPEWLDELDAIRRDRLERRAEAEVARSQPAPSFWRLIRRS